MMDRDRQTLWLWPNPGKHISGRPSGSYLPETGDQKNLAPERRPQGRRGPRTSEFGPQMSDPDERPPGRRGARSSNQFKEVSDEKITDPSCESLRTQAKAESSVFPSIPHLPNLVSRTFRVDKGTSQHQWPVAVPKSMPAMEPTCLPIIPQTRPRKTGTVVVDNHHTSYHLSTESTSDIEYAKMWRPRPPGRVPLLARRAALAKGLIKKEDTTSFPSEYRSNVVLELIKNPITRRI